MAEFHCKGCRGDICEYCFSFKENLCEECSRNGPRCGVCRESSFLTKGIECQFCKTYYCTRHSAGQDDYRRFGFVQGPCCLACLRDETRRRRDPEGNRVKNRSPGGAPETNPTRSFSPPLRPPVDRFRDTPTGDQPNAADLQSPPKAAQHVPLDKRETGYYPGFDPNGTRPKDPSGLEPPTMRGPDPPDKKCRMCDRDIPDPSKIGECKICMKRACEICIPKATRLCPVCALSIGSSNVPQHLFGTGGGGYNSHHDPNCTAATKCIAIDLPPEPDAAGLRVWIANMKEAVSNAYSYDGLYAINWLTEVEKAKTFDELDGECKYHILEARFNAAIRKCIKTVAIIDKINRLTEAAQRSNNRIKSRQILWLLYDHLRTANILDIQMSVFFLDICKKHVKDKNVLIFSTFRILPKKQPFARSGNLPLRLAQACSPACKCVFLSGKP